MRPWAPLEFSRAWLGKADAVLRRRADLEAQGLLNGASVPDLVREGAALSGELRIPVIAVRYADTPEPFAIGALADRLFGSTRGDSVSLADYWDEVSGGLLRVDGLVTGWATLRRQAQYYLEGSRYGWGSFGKVSEFRRHVVDQVDPSVDFAQFDNDGPDGIPDSGDDDGFVDFVAFFYATRCGDGSQDGAIWPHRGAMAPVETDDPARNGGRIRIADYIILPAQDPATCGPAHIGVLAHETAHAFGLPDLYDYDGSSRGIGSWGLMGTGSHASPHSPAHLSAWAKEQLGWIRLDWVTTGRTAALPEDGSSRSALRYDLEDGSGRYLLMEGRGPAGSDRDLPGHGLLVWAVDPERGELGVWNGDERRPAVALLGADGAGALFPSGGRDFSGPFPGRARAEAASERFPVRLVTGTAAGAYRIRVEPDESLRWPEGELGLVTVLNGPPLVRRLALSGAQAARPGTGWIARTSAPWLRLATDGWGLRMEADPWRLPVGVYTDTVKLVDEASGRILDRMTVRLDVEAHGRPTIAARGLPWSWGLALDGGDLVHAGVAWDALGLRPRPRLLRLDEAGSYARNTTRLPAEALYAPVSVPGRGVYVLARANGENYLYRVGSDGSAEMIAARLGRDPAYGLAALPDGSLLVAGWSGRILRVTPDGDVHDWAKLGRAVYQITADPRGVVYAALLSGEILRVAPDGRALTIPTGFERGRLVALTAGPDGRVFAAERGGQGQVVEVAADSVRVVARVDGAEFYGLASDGMFLHALDLGHRQIVRIPVGSGTRLMADGVAPTLPPVTLPHREP